MTGHHGIYPHVATVTVLPSRPGAARGRNLATWVTLETLVTCPARSLSANGLARIACLVSTTVFCITL